MDTKLDQQLLIKRGAPSSPVASMFLVLALSGMSASADAKWIPDVNAHHGGLSAQFLIDEYGELTSEGYWSQLMTQAAQGARTANDGLSSALCALQDVSCFPAQDIINSALPSVTNVEAILTGADGNNVLVNWLPPIDLYSTPSYRFEYYDIKLFKDGAIHQRLKVTVETEGEPGNEVVSANFDQLQPGHYTVLVRPYFRRSDLDIEPYELGRNTPGDAKRYFAYAPWQEAEFVVTASSVSQQRLSEVLLDTGLKQCLMSHYGVDFPVNEIETIRCPDSGVTSLEGLDQFTSLKLLDLHNTSNSSNLNQIDSLEHLVNDNGEVQNVQLETIDLSGMHIHSSTNLWESFNKFLPRFNSLRNVNLSNTQLDRLPALAVGKQKTLALQSLHLANNQLSKVDELAGLQALHYLYLDGNPLGNEIMGADSPLAAFDQMLSLSLDNTQLVNDVDVIGLPDTLGFLSVRNNADLEQLRVSDETMTSIVYYVDMTENTNLSCSGLDAFSAWFNAQDNLPQCVGSDVLGAECLNPQLIGAGVLDSYPCTADAPELLTVRKLGNELDYLIEWNAVPAHWSVDFYRVWYREAEFLPDAFVQVRADDKQIKIRPSTQSLTSYEFAIQSCQWVEEQIECGGLSDFRRHSSGPELARKYW